MKTKKKNGPQKLPIIDTNLIFHSPAHSPELIFHSMNIFQDASVSLSVIATIIKVGAARKI